MPTSSRALAAHVFAVVVGLAVLSFAADCRAASPGSRDTADASLTQQIRDRYEHLRADSPVEDAATLLNDANAALETDAPLVALQALARACVAQASVQLKRQYVPDDAAEKPDFEKLMQTIGEVSGRRLDRIRAQLASATPPLVVRGWIDIVLARQKAFFDTSVGYERDARYAGASDSYVVYSLAELEEVSHLLDYRYDVPPAAPAFHGLESGLKKIEGQVLDRFKGTSRGNVYPPTVVANAAVDFARKLIDAGQETAAVLSYLRAVTALNEMIIKEQGAPDAGDLAGRQQRWAERIAGARGDQSIAMYYLQQAEVALASVAAGDAGRSATAAAILDATLPAYFELIEPGPESATAGATPDDAGGVSGPVATVTILRYPYT